MNFNIIVDNIDTRVALDVIKKLVNNSNIYVKDCQKPNVLLLRDIAVYITKIFTVFGTITSHDSIGFPVEDKTANVS